MNTRLQTAIALVVLGVSGTMVTHNAKACDIGDMLPLSAQHWTLAPPARGKATLTTNAMALDSQAFGPTDNHPAHFGPPSPRHGRSRITGLYEFTFTSEGTEGIPDGAVIDHGFATWHDDGTEIMNSGRPPKTGSFCMGAWKRTGPRSYKLNHYALNWDDTGTMLLGTTRIHENVDLARDANSFSGEFTIDVIDTNGTTVLAHLQGTVDAARLTADSD